MPLRGEQNGKVLGGGRGRYWGFYSAPKGFFLHISDILDCGPVLHEVLKKIFHLIFIISAKINIPT